MNEERYVPRRIDGAWYVVDGEHTVSEHGAGAAGALGARAAAAERNTRWAKDGGRAAELRTWRVAHGLSQPALARRLGVQPLAISRWETGERTVPALLARALRDLDRELAN